MNKIIFIFIFFNLNAQWYESNAIASKLNKITKIKNEGYCIFIDSKIDKNLTIIKKILYFNKEEIRSFEDEYKDNVLQKEREFYKNSLRFYRIYNNNKLTIEENYKQKEIEKKIKNGKNIKTLENIIDSKINYYYNDNAISHKSIFKDDKLLYTDYYYYRYDKRLRSIVRLYSYEDSEEYKEQSYLRFVYNNDNFIKKEWIKDKETEHVSEYDKDLRLINIKIYDLDNKFLSKKEYEYKKNSTLAIKETITEKNKIEIRNFDSLGRLETSIAKNKNGILFELVLSYLNDTQKVTARNIVTEKKQEQYIYTYDNEDKLREASYYLNNKIQSNAVYFYQDLKKDKIEELYFKGKIISKIYYKDGKIIKEEDIKDKKVLRNREYSY